MEEKRIRRDDLNLIKRESEILEGERRQLAQKLVEYEPMLEAVKELKAYGISLEVLKSYIDMIEIKAIAEYTDPKTAANDLLTSSP